MNEKKQQRNGNREALWVKDERFAEKEIWLPAQSVIDVGFMGKDNLPQHPGQWPRVAVSS